MSNVYNKDYKFFKYNCDGIFATGRIKRMRKGESVCNGILRRIHGTSIVIPRGNPDMYEIMMLTQDTRWNRH